MLFLELWLLDGGFDDNHSYFQCWFLHFEEKGCHREDPAEVSNDTVEISQVNLIIEKCYVFFL